MNACHLLDIGTAIRDCLSTAKATRYRNINDVAAAMDVSREVLYKWVQTGRIPAVQVPAFEQACADASLTRALAAAQGYLLVPATADSQTPELALATVQSQVAAALLAAATAQVDTAQAGQAVRSITQAIDGLAALRHRYAKAAS